ncbi:RadC family protein [Amphritea pacifica]|uniref:DNA repair protein RadC n=1 Tax=Amphritea pacifica TaxID=2811233 RepID=A0ABS2W8V1_9GAMM|nr:DNA repair protein RadC [Amphritea pacifica]MBN0988145.1 DNA repair protein RadC [Amphritea pacifica]MBN1007588.1 DNA repair protein RadC [Amphritea pacifica]
MAITDWPEAERPREKLLRQGAASLSDGELLAIFLRTGVKGCSAVDLARQLLTRFGGLRALIKSDQQTFCQQLGLGPAKYVQLQAVMEISRRCQAEQLQRDSALTSPDLVRDYLQLQLSDRSREVFACLLLDSQHRVICFEELFKGTIDSATVHPREVVKLALSHNAAAMILAHNHPSGIAEPSMADQHITQRIKEALSLVDIRLLDHMVVGSGVTVSLAERGLI